MLCVCMQVSMDFKSDMKTILNKRKVKNEVIANLKKHWPEFAEAQGLKKAEWEHWEDQAGIWWSWLKTRPNSYKGIRDSITRRGAMYDTWITHNHRRKRASWCTFISYIQMYTGIASVDASGMSSLALIVVCSWNAMFTNPMHTRFYLQLEDADPAQLDNNALTMAVESKNSEVVALLLADERVGRASDPWHVVQISIAHGTDKILKMLVNDSRYLNFWPANVLDSAVRFGVPSILRILLDAPTLDISDSALDTACERYDDGPAVTDADHAACLRMLLADDRFDVFVGNARIMRSTIDYQLFELTKILLDDPRTSLAVATSALLHDVDYAEQMPLARHLLDNYLPKLRDGVANLLTLYIQCGEAEFIFQAVRRAVALP